MASKLPKIDKSAWSEIDTASLPPDAAKAYAALKDAQSVARKAREHFEAVFGKNAAPGTRWVFGYNFGKLSIAVVAGDKPEAKSSKAVPFSTLVKKAAVTV